MYSPSIEAANNIRIFSSLCWKEILYASRNSTGCDKNTLGRRQTLISYAQCRGKVTKSPRRPYSDIGEQSSSCLVIFSTESSMPEVRLTLDILVQQTRPLCCPDASWLGKIFAEEQNRPRPAAEITTLIEYLYPHDPDLKIYLAGGSYGTVPAQILYGALFDVFPFGKQVMGCMFLAPISPLRLHKGHRKSMTTSTYLAMPSVVVRRRPPSPAGFLSRTFVRHRHSSLNSRLQGST